jgi:DNA sulfur modification protein DndD
MTENPKLFLQKISVTNYRSYCGKNEILFSNDSKRTITVIHGDMGRGKTTIMDALYWCLYNSEPEKPQKKDQVDESVINSNAYKLLEIGQSDKTEIEIIFSDEYGPYFFLTRTIEFTKESDETELRFIKTLSGKIPKGLKIKESISLTERDLDVSGSSKIKLKDPIADPSIISDKIEELFPQSLAMFFLFDAELLDKFFHTKNNYVKQGIEDITGLPILKNMTNNFYKVKELQTDVESLDPVLNIKKEELNTYKSNVNNLELEKKEIQTLIENKNNEISGLESQLDAIGGTQYISLKEKKIEILADMKKINDQIISINLLLQQLISKSLPILLLTKTLQTVEKRFDDDEKEGRLPTPITPTALRKIIETKLCICENHLNDEKIEDFKKQLVLSGSSPLIQNISAGRLLLSNLLTTYSSKKVEGRIDEFRKQRLNFRTELTDKKRALKNIEDQMGEVSDEEVSQLRNLIKTKRDVDKSQLDRDLGSVEGKLVTAKEELQESDEGYTELMKKRDDLKDAYRKQLIAEFCAKESSRLREELIEELRIDAEKHTSKFFLELVKCDDFQSVEISKDYTTKVLGHDGVAQGISAGQGVAMALSFIAAMREITGQKYFLFIDSGYHKMSQSERLSLAQGFASYLTGTQITLLVQGQEYTGESKKDIDGDVITSVRNELQKLNILYREYLLNQVPKIREDLKSCTQIKLYKDYLGVD